MKFDPSEYAHLALMNFQTDSLYVAYLFDPARVDPSRPLCVSFRKNAATHVGVICAVPDGDHWTITNVRSAQKGMGVGMWLHLVAADDLFSIVPCSTLSEGSRVLWSRIKEDPRVRVGRSGNVELKYPASTVNPDPFGAKPLVSNYEKFTVEQRRERGLTREGVEDEVLFTVLDGFAVVDMGKAQ